MNSSFVYLDQSFIKCSYEELVFGGVLYLLNPKPYKNGKNVARLGSKLLKSVQSAEQIQNFCHEGKIFGFELCSHNPTRVTNSIYKKGGEHKSQIHKYWSWQERPIKLALVPSGLTKPAAFILVSTATVNSPLIMCLENVIIVSDGTVSVNRK